MSLGVNSLLETLGQGLHFLSVSFCSVCFLRTPLWEFSLFPAFGKQRALSAVWHPIKKTPEEERERGRPE